MPENLFVNDNWSLIILGVKLLILENYVDLYIIFFIKKRERVLSASAGIADPVDSLSNFYPGSTMTDF